MALAVCGIPSAHAWETDFGGMPFYTGSVLPTPQQANYHDGYFSLDNAAVVLGQGILSTDPRLDVLRHRVEEMGGSLSVVGSLAGAPGFSSIIALGDVPGLTAPRTPPQRDEGYIMAVLEHQGQDVILLQGSDDIGLLWAIVSLNQLTTRMDGVAVARKADLYDYPVHTLRGYISGWGTDAVEDELWYIVNFKMNNVYMRRFQRRGGAWRDPQPEAVYAAVERTGELLTPLGIRWYDGYRPINRDPEIQLNIADGEDFEIILGHARRVVEAGGGVSMAFDDHRFPIHPADMERFGTAREADVYFLQNIHRELSAINPDVRILYCPPFYWGPGGHAYPESQTDYLEALADLPESIDIFWTGPQVKGRTKTREHVEWISNLIGRKPTVWQNRGWTPHVFNFHYHTDPVTAWIDWHYDGFFDEVAAYMPNTHMPASAAAVLTLIDYLWNPDAYDPERSAREVAMKLTGPESYPLMVELNEKLSYFDQFNFRETPAAARHHEEMQQHLDSLMRVWERVEASHGETVLRWTNMQRYPALHARFVQRIGRRPDLNVFASAAEEALRGALADGFDYDDANDIFLSPYDFTGGAAPIYYAHNTPRRPATWIHAADSAFPAMQAQFEADPFPPAGDYLLVISGLDNDAGAPAGIRIKVNDTIIFQGPNNFDRSAWSIQQFRIPGQALERYNRLVIESLDAGESIRQPPWFMLNYAVLRKIGD